MTTTGITLSEPQPPVFRALLLAARGNKVALMLNNPDPLVANLAEHIEEYGIPEGSTESVFKVFSAAGKQSIRFNNGGCLLIRRPGPLRGAVLDVVYVDTRIALTDRLYAEIMIATCTSSVQGRIRHEELVR